MNSLWSRCHRHLTRYSDRGVRDRICDDDHRNIGCSQGITELETRGPLLYASVGRNIYL